MWTSLSLSGVVFGACWELYERVLSAVRSLVFYFLFPFLGGFPFLCMIKAIIVIFKFVRIKYIVFLVGIVLVLAGMAVPVTSARL